MLNKKIRKILFEVVDAYKTDMSCHYYGLENTYQISGQNFQLIVDVSDDCVHFTVDEMRFDKKTPRLFYEQTLFNKSDIENVLHGMKYYIGCEDFKEFLEKLEIILKEGDSK